MSLTIILITISDKKKLLMNKKILFSNILWKATPVFTLFFLITWFSELDQQLQYYLYFSLGFSLIINIRYWRTELLEIDTYHYYSPVAIASIAFGLERAITVIEATNWVEVDFSIVIELPFNLLYLMGRSMFLWLVIVFIMALPYYSIYITFKLLELVIDLFSNDY